jgi:dihydrofolate reductase
MEHFVKTTMGKVVVMGRATFDSIPKKLKPLEGRINVVLTRDRDWSYPGVEVRHSLDEAIREFGFGKDELMIIGGGQIYADAINAADRLYLTIVTPPERKQADAFFPEYEAAFPTIVDRQHFVDEKTDLAYTFETRERAK